MGNTLHTDLSPILVATACIHHDKMIRLRAKYVLAVNSVAVGIGLRVEDVPTSE